MSEFEAFAKAWEAHEQSRHARLMEELKREFRAEPRSAPVEEAIAAPHSLRLPPAVPRRQSYSRYPGRGEGRSGSGSAMRSPRQTK